jgi:hypothetical protein
MPTPVRYPNGISTQPVNHPMGQFGLPDPADWHYYFNDFDVYAAGDWTVTKVGTGTQALAAGNGGLLLSTTTIGAADSVLNQLTVASFAYTAGKKIVFRVRGQVSDATTSAFHAGLIATTTTPLAAVDGLFVYKATAGTSAVLRNTNNSVNTDTTITGFTAVNATNFDLGFYVDQNGRVVVYDLVNSPLDGPVAAGTVSQRAVNLALSFGITNGAAAAKTMTLDHIVVGVER